MTVYIILAAITLILAYLFMRKENLLHKIPSPKGLPIIGNTFQLDPHQPHVYLTNLAKKYGDLYCLNLLGTPIVVANGSEALHEMLVTKGDDFSGRPHTIRTWKYSNYYNDVVFANPSPRRKLLKKMQMGQVKLIGGRRGVVEKIIQESILEMIDELKRLTSDEKPVNIVNTLELTLTDIMYTMIHGRRSGNELELRQICDISVKLLQVTEVGGSGEWLDLFPWLRFFGHSVWNVLEEQEKRRWHMYHEWKARLKDDQASGENVEDSMLYRLLQITNDDSDDKVTKECVQYVVWQMFLAGILTTRSNVNCLFNVLVNYPDVQHKLQAEVDKVAGDRVVDIDDKKNMPYHQATVFELLRYASTAPFLVPHMTLCQTSLKGYTIPANTIVWPNAWGLHHDESLWDEPDKFKPGRFLDADGNLIPADNPNRYNMLAFSAGPRVCAGEVFGLTRIFLLLTMMMQHFHLKPATTMSDQTSCLPKDMLSGSLLETPPYAVRLEIRNAE